MAREQPKLPPHARKVFEGTIHDTWQWEQELYDGSVATFEALTRTDSVTVIAETEGKFLVLSQEQPSLPPFTSFPGGRMDPGEEPLESAKRELLEETGYVSEDWELLQTHKPLPKMDWHIYQFVARNCRKAAEPHLDAGERIDVRQDSFDELFALIDEPAFREKLFKDMLHHAAHDATAYAGLHKRLLGKAPSLPRIEGCLACDIQEGKRELPGGSILSSTFFEAHQDFAVPIPGFVIIAAKWHVRSIADMTPIQRADFIHLEARLRQGLREALGIESMHIYHEEDTRHHFHYGLFPRYPWMTEFGTRIESIKPITEHAKAHMQDRWQEVNAATAKLKEYSGS